MKETPEYKIEQLNPDLFDELIPIMLDCFGKEVNIDYFKWKYLDNPAGKIVAFIARDAKNEIAAFYGVIPEKYYINNEVKTVFQSMDTMTHSSHRRKGLFKELANKTYDFLQSENMLFVIGFGGPTSTPGFIKFGWKNPFDLSYYFKLSFQSKWQQLFLGSNKEVIIKENIKNDQLADLIKKFTHSNPTISKYIYPEFINWRLSNPNINYKTQVIFINEEAIGYIIYHLVERDIYILHIGSKNDKHSIKYLSNQLNNLLLTSGKRGLITFAQKGSPYQLLLKHMRFIHNNTNYGPLKTKIPFIFFSDEIKMNQFYSPLNWNITPIDHDSF